MRLMDEVVLSGDHKIPQLGSGGICSDVYPQIVPHNLTVNGGGGVCLPGIGVGGFATGGMSFEVLSNR